MPAMSRRSVARRLLPLPSHFLMFVLALLTTTPCPAQDGGLDSLRKLLGDDGGPEAPGDQLGFSIALDGDVVALGAPGHDRGGFNRGAAFIFRRHGTAWSEEALLIPPSVSRTAELGGAVALDGTALGAGVLAVGAPQEDAAAFNGGAVYLFEEAGGAWEEGQRLVASDAGSGDLFGSAVALDGDTLVVGAPRADAVYVFIRQGLAWSQSQKLTPSDGTVGGFGQHVALDGDHLVVGAPSADAAFANAGAAFVFVRQGGVWSQEQKLTAGADAEEEARFGDAVAVSTTPVPTLLVGARFDDDPEHGSQTGAVHVFVRTGGTWSQQDRLLSETSPGGSREFGSSVAVVGDSALIGAADEVVGFDPIGVAYVFERSGAAWHETQRLPNPDPNDFDGFGATVAFDGTSALVGTPSDGFHTNDSGSVFVFTKTGTWTQQARLFGRGTPDGDHFGNAVDTGTAQAIVGAVGDDHNGLEDAGAAYIFTHDVTTHSWSREAKLVAPVPGSREDFGAAVGIQGDTALVGRGDVRGGAYVFTRGAEGWSFHQELIPSGNVSATSFFGQALALSGDLAVVAADAETVNGVNDAGAVYVFLRSGGTWFQEKRLVAPISMDRARFGRAVDLFGDLLAVAAPREDSADGLLDETGKVYIFRRDGGLWPLVAEVQADVLVEDAQFGRGVALGGGVAGQRELAVGAPGDDTPVDAGAGAVYIFRDVAGDGTGWSSPLKLWPADGGRHDAFGSSIALWEFILSVGEPANDNLGNGSGRVHNFLRDAAGTWVARQSFAAAETVAGDTFGAAVAQYGDTVVVGAPAAHAADGTEDVGAAYTRWIDFATPSPPQSFVSTSHVVGEWSSQERIDLEWSGASDPPGGAELDGYSVLFDRQPAAEPDRLAEVPHGSDPHSTSSPPLAEGQDHWVHLRTCDRVGNCATVLHLGPFWVDATPPVVGGPISSSHTPGEISSEALFSASWSATDGGSGVEDFAVSLSLEALGGCDGPRSAETSLVDAPLAPGSWWLHVCAVDALGNVSAVSSAGPFVIDPSAGIFTDGFESGNTSAWSNTHPGGP